jgi:CheY-like chemotaxis protein
MILYIYVVAYRIITQHNGNLSVYSPGEGLGCTFTMELPLCMSSDQINNNSVDINNGNNDTITLSNPLILNSNIPSEIIDISVSQNIHENTNINENVILYENTKVMKYENINLIDINNKDNKVINDNIIKIVKKILIVDDAMMNRKMLKRLLDGRIDIIIEADDGNIAVNLIKDMINNNKLPYSVNILYTSFLVQEPL